MALSRKYYQMFAEMFGEIKYTYPNNPPVEMVIANTLMLFKSDNSAFNPERFKDAIEKEIERREKRYQENARRTEEAIAKRQAGKPA